MTTYYKLSNETSQRIVSLIQDGVLNERDITDDLKAFRFIPNPIVLHDLDLTDSNDEAFYPSDIFLMHLVDLFTLSYVTGVRLQTYLVQMRLEVDESNEVVLTSEYFNYIRSAVDKMVVAAEEKLQGMGEATEVETH